METDEVTKLVDGIYKNILDKFNPGARQMINAGKAYLKALHEPFGHGIAYAYGQHVISEDWANIAFPYQQTSYFLQPHQQYFPARGGDEYMPSNANIPSQILTSLPDFDHYSSPLFISPFGNDVIISVGGHDPSSNDPDTVISNYPTQEDWDEMATMPPFPSWIFPPISGGGRPPSSNDPDDGTSGGDPPSANDPQMPPNEGGNMPGSGIPTFIWNLTGNSHIQIIGSKKRSSPQVLNLPSSNYADSPLYHGKSDDEVIMSGVGANPKEGWNMTEVSPMDFPPVNEWPSSWNPPSANNPNGGWDMPGIMHPPNEPPYFPSDPDTSPGSPPQSDDNVVITVNGKPVQIASPPSVPNVPPQHLPPSFPQDNQKPPQNGDSSDEVGNDLTVWQRVGAKMAAIQSGLCLKSLYGCVVFDAYLLGFAQVANSRHLGALPINPPLKPRQVKLLRRALKLSGLAVYECEAKYFLELVTYTKLPMPESNCETN